MNTPKGFCGTCRFFEPNAGKKGECRINPPTFSAATSGFVVTGLGLFGKTCLQGWPDTDKDQWCGKYEMKKSDEGSGA